MENASSMSWLFSVLGRGTAHVFPEGFCEIAHVLETAANCNIGNFLSGFRQKRCSLPDTELLEILYGGGADGFAETSQTFAFADTDRGSDISGGEFAIELSVDEVQHGFDPLSIPQIFAADRGGSRGEVAAQEPDQF